MEAKKMFKIGGFVLGGIILVVGGYFGYKQFSKPPNVDDISKEEEYLKDLAAAATEAKINNVTAFVSMAKQRLTKAECERFATVLRKLTYFKAYPTQVTNADAAAFQLEYVTLLKKLK